MAVASVWRTQYLTILPPWYSSPQPTILTEWYPVLDPDAKFEHLYMPDLYTKKSLVTFITAAKNGVNDVQLTSYYIILQYINTKQYTDQLVMSISQINYYIMYINT